MTSSTHTPAGSHTPARVSAFRVLLGVVVLASLCAAGGGVALVVGDLSERGEMFDGLGAAIGGGIVVVAVLAGVMATVAAVLAVRRPLAARVIGALLALAATAVVYPLAVDTSWGVWLFALPLALVVVAVLPDAPAR